MSEEINSEHQTEINIQPAKKDKENYLLHIGLFLFTFVTTTIAGVEWISGSEGPYDIHLLLKGLPYSISILFIIGVHEIRTLFRSKISQS